MLFATTTYSANENMKTPYPIYLFTEICLPASPDFINPMQTNICVHRPPPSGGGVEGRRSVQFGSKFCVLVMGYIRNTFP
jgi:hypothetical protein